MTAPIPAAEAIRTSTKEVSNRLRPHQHGTHPQGLGRAQVFRRILDHDAATGRQTEAGDHLVVRLGVGLGAVGGHADVEEVLELVGYPEGRQDPLGVPPGAVGEDHLAAAAAAGGAQAGIERAESTSTSCTYSR
jgi:hypothetical protein